MIARGRLIAQIVLAVVLSVWALIVLEGARSGVAITHTSYGETPVTRYATADGPHVVMAHGFAGSREMMQGYALVLARAGYVVHAFDFEGHGRHPEPMRGDVNALDGTTQRLVDQTRAVMAAVGEGETPIALVGHSMATDILVRVAEAEPQQGPLVLISAFSRAVTATQPQAALFVAGAWEPGLAAFAVEALKMVDPAAQAGATVQVGDVVRRAVEAPLVEHVAILQSRAARAEALNWLNAYYQRDQTAAVPQTGWALIALLFAIMLGARPLSLLVPARVSAPAPLGVRNWALVAGVPAVVAPLVAVNIPLELLPVLVADYLALHLLIFGVLQLGLMIRFGPALPRPNVRAGALLLVWGLGVFGAALHRYGANFWPSDDRAVIIAALAIGAVPFMLADGWVAWGAPLWQRIAGRAMFLASLGAAVALDFEGLFFLLMIAPVILLFLIIFGTMGRGFTKRTGPASAGISLGLVLAWALGVSFPLFAG
ncbi:MAG: alpha/beta fold hydrolase [Pseudomonadota bacterium]